MSSTGPDDPPAPAPDPAPEPARNLFGHKSGAKPWDSPRAGPPDGSPAPSAPYPRDAQYTPRGEPAPEHATTPATTPVPTPDPVDDDGALTLLHPNYKLMMRVGAILLALVVLGGAAAIEGALRSELGVPLGVLLVPAGLFALFLAIRMPLARYNARGYQMGSDRLRVVRGVMFRSDTIVPFGRVQHIDVDQGPIERALGIATLTLHTAGSHNASVRLPGLGHERAVEMRETIRAHIKRESL